MMVNSSQRRWLYLLAICIGLGLPASQVWAQAATGFSLEGIKAAYNRFDYAEVISLSLQSLTAVPSPSVQEQVEIYKYLAFARVSTGQNESARKDFESALQLNPELTLDPAYVSPKIIALFDEVKKETMARQPGTSEAPAKAIDSAQLRSGAAWRSLLVPGWGQWHKNQKGKAMAIVAVQTAQIGLLAYNHVKTGQTHDKYLEARDPADIDSAYKKYNSFHKRRSYMMLSTAAVWLYAHIDAALSPESGTAEANGKKTSSGLQPSQSGDMIGCRYVIEF